MEGLRNLNFHDGMHRPKMALSRPEPTMSFSSLFSRFSLSTSGAFRSALRRMAARLVAARRHAHQRFEIRGMSDHELKDLGLGRSEVQEWLRRPAPTARRGTEGLRAPRTRRPPGAVVYARA